jgi:4-hydroxybenzoate polyprenyltransferase
MTTSPLTPPAATPLMKRLAIFAADIKINHTVFAMPWALLSAVLAGHDHPASLTAGKIALIVVCMISARTVAMAANRLLDAEIDARNPRTARRAIPAGSLSRTFVIVMLAICCGSFIAATALFEILYKNPWPLTLAIPVLLFLSAYPFLKRFTRLCHYYLGAALALAPLCAWLAIAGRLNLPPVLMFLAVISWTAGFDIIYACQDYEFDVAAGLHSVPAGSGVARALWISRLTHVFSAAMILALEHVVPVFRGFYFTGAGAAVALLVVEHSLVSAKDLSKANLAFFTVNGVISVVVGTLGIVDILR